MEAGGTMSEILLITRLNKWLQDLNYNHLHVF